MNGKAKQHAWGVDHKIHHCPRHHDLTILLNNAKKDICSTCFATLKKSYFNVTAGMLLEQEYLHNVSKGLIEQNNILQKKLQHQEKHLLNLTHEIAEIKNNGRNHETSRPKTPQQQSANPTPVVSQQPPSNAQEICTEGHVAKATLALGNLLHGKIAQILESWHKKRATTTPKKDDLQDTSATTHPHHGKLIK